MSYYVYILLTERNNKKITYTGYTKNLKNRLMLHNNGKGAKFTRGSFWKVIYKKKFKDKKSAIRFEYLIKNKRILKLKLLNE